MTVTAWLEGVLPTKWSALLAKATVVLSASAAGLPSLLPISYLPESPEQIFLLRLLLLLLSALVGSLAVLILVVCHARQLRGQAKSLVSYIGLATVATALGVSLLPVLLPSSYLPALPEQIFILSIALTLLALACTLVVLFFMVRHVRNIETRNNRSFWDVGS